MKDLEAKRNRYALLVGINDYPLEIGVLKGPKNDIKLLGDVLQNYGQFQVEYNTSDDTNQLEKQISRFFTRKELSSTDTLLFYFSGHGITYDGDFYFMTSSSDWEIENVGSIISNKIYSWINNSKAKSSIIVLDCCNAGAFIRGRQGIIEDAAEQLNILENQFELNSVKGTFIIASCLDGQNAREDWKCQFYEKSFGFFTKAFVDGITSGEAARSNDSEIITLNDAFEYAKNNLKTKNMVPNVSMKGHGIVELAFNPNNPHYKDLCSSTKSLRVLMEDISNNESFSDRFQIPPTLDHHKISSPDLIKNRRIKNKKSKINCFLDAIDQPNSAVFDKIHKIFVPPSNYKQIKKILKYERIVFITGPPYVGKTYTSVRLLWEHFKKGYIPVYFSGKTLYNRDDNRKRIANLGRILIKHHIYYFEDPFGNVKYEKRAEIEREIKEIVKFVRNIRDVYILITSREEVFNNFKQEQLMGVEIEKFEKKLHFNEPIYDIKGKQKILMKWAKAEKCLWLKKKKLKKYLKLRIKEEKILPTPLNIRDFCVDSTTIIDKNRLEEVLKERSKDLAREFAKEILLMTREKQVFLSIVFILRYPSIKNLSALYNDIRNDLNLKSDLNTTFNWFVRDKIQNFRTYLSFSHPSYYEALSFVLSDRKNESKKIKNDFYYIMRKIESSNLYNHNFPSIITQNFQTAPEDIKEMLIKLSKDSNYVKDVIFAMAERYSFLSDKYKEFFEDFGKDKNTLLYYTVGICMYYDTFPKKHQDLILNSIKDENKSIFVLKAIIDNYDYISSSLKELLLELVENEEYQETILW
ncbi:MAG: caspase family protein, partial [Promethearchaeota archaeon]